MLERLYPINILVKNPVFALLMGVGYSIIGIGLAVILFPEDPALVAVALISIMFYPTINSLLKETEDIESKKEELNLLTFVRDHKHVFIIYIFMFVGVVLTFASFALVLDSLATNHIFENQINILYGYNSGQATFEQNLFFDILKNNMVVLIVIFSTAFLLGDGGLFLLVWNASVWGTIFGNLARTAAINTNQSPLYYFLMVILIVTPHMLMEAFAYIAAATTGGVISKAIIKERLLSSRFNMIIINTVISLVFSLSVLLLAVSIETYVLGNATTYQEIIRQSFLG